MSFLPLIPPIVNCGRRWWEPFSLEAPETECPELQVMHFYTGSSICNLRSAIHHLPFNLNEECESDTIKVWHAIILFRIISSGETVSVCARSNQIHFNIGWRRVGWRWSFIFDLIMLCVLCRRGRGWRWWEISGPKQVWGWNETSFLSLLMDKYASLPCVLPVTNNEEEGIKLILSFLWFTRSL